MQFWSLKGHIHYEDARQLQLHLVDLRVQDQIPDTVLFLEHKAVITRGRGLQFTGASRPRHMPLLQPLPEGMECVETERGGDLTYHGPGQLVIYPICKLDGKGYGPNHDVAGFLRKIEGILIEELASRGLPATSQENATGVWVGPKKVASMGIAIRKWVTYHGMAINCINDLRPFYLISPCGFQPEMMTRLGDLIPLSGSWRQNLEEAWIKRMVSQAPETSQPVFLELDLEEARAKSGMSLSRPVDLEVPFGS